MRLPAAAIILQICKIKTLKYQGQMSMRISEFSAGEEGIEPPFTVLETAALPLYYSPMWFLQLFSN